MAPLVAELEAEREGLTACARQPSANVDIEALRPSIEARVVEMSTAFAGAPVERRAAFRALLGDRRMRVLPDAARRFRVEGLFELTLETADAGPSKGDGVGHHR